MKQDRFMIGILIFIGILVAVALVLFFIHNKPPTYGPEDAPTDVLYNYAVALQLHDYQRAYNYLAEKDNKPTYDTFHLAFINRQLDTSNTALQIGDVQTLQNGEAWVNVSVEYAGNGIFNDSWSSTGQAVLEQEDGAWKITALPNPYWGWDWYQPTPASPK
jgi:hypothetical protein